jgi:hypothetical protein
VDFRSSRSLRRTENFSGTYLAMVYPLLRFELISTAKTNFDQWSSRNSNQSLSLMKLDQSGDEVRFERSVWLVSRCSETRDHILLDDMGCSVSSNSTNKSPGFRKIRDIQSENRPSSSLRICGKVVLGGGPLKYREK